MIRHIHLRVQSLSQEAEGVLGIELVPLRADMQLPAFEAGAHVDLHLPTEGGETVRSYSLVNDPAERHRWCVAVKHEAGGRGGSGWIHRQLQCGQLLRVGVPRNHFALRGDGSPAVFIAGGIGITPILAMLRALVARGHEDWTLHYGARHRRAMAYVDVLQDLSARAGGQLHLHVDEEAGAALDVPGIVAAAPADAHLYACGPRPMLQAVVAAAASRPRETLHLESFDGAVQADVDASRGFTVLLRRSSRELSVRPGQTILEAVLAAGIAAQHGCRSGFCGSCEVAVLAGEPEHRDLLLSPHERTRLRSMLICCGGSRTPVLEIDL
jgi:tetrachlorobenzoquinone reductase